MNKEIIAGLVIAGFVIFVPKRRLYDAVWSSFSAIGNLFRKTNKQKDKFISNGSELDRNFQRACQLVGQCRKLSNEQQLEFYGLYKQATQGDNNKPKPSAIHIVELKKWEAWLTKAGLTEREAQRSYINLQKKLIGDDAPVKTSNGDDEDDLFMTEEEYQQHKKEKSGNTTSSSMGMIMSKPILIAEKVTKIEGADRQDVMKFFEYVEQENIDGLKKMIAAGFDLKRFNAMGITSLHYAVDSEKEDALDFLLEQFEDCNVRDINGDTPLHFAVNLENEEIITKLLSKNANPNLENKAGETPFELAPKALKHLLAAN